MKERIENTHKNWKNSYKDIYIWLKGELLDIKAVADALTGREAVCKLQMSCE
jgi:uncharacterized protein (UPF0335 family)